MEVIHITISLPGLGRSYHLWDTDLSKAYLWPYHTVVYVRITLLMSRNEIEATGFWFFFLKTKQNLSTAFLFNIKFRHRDKNIRNAKAEFLYQ